MCNVLCVEDYLCTQFTINGFTDAKLTEKTRAQPSFKDMFINIGFTIEGRDDSELPECLFGCGQLHRPNHDFAVDLFEQADLEDA